MTSFQRIIRIFAICTLFLAAMASADTTSVVNARPSINGKLHVEGTNLFDEHGNQVVIKGASTHGLTWFPQYINNNLFRQMSREWNTNLIRRPARPHRRRDSPHGLLYDRTPTLPQRLRLGEGHIDNLWNNIAHRIVTR